MDPHPSCSALCVQECLQDLTLVLLENDAGMVVRFVTVEREEIRHEEPNGRAVFGYRVREFKASMNFRRLSQKIKGQVKWCTFKQSWY